MIKLEKIKYEENGLVLDDLNLQVENGEIYFLISKDDYYNQSSQFFDDQPFSEYFWLVTFYALVGALT